MKVLFRVGAIRCIVSKELFQLFACIEGRLSESLFVVEHGCLAFKGSFVMNTKGFYPLNGFLGRMAEFPKQRFR